MNFAPPDAAALALFGVMCAGNIFLLWQRFRRRFARFFPLSDTVLADPDPKFKQLNAFAYALHTIAHDYGLEVTAIAYNEKERTYQSYNFGVERCDASDAQRAQYLFYAAQLLAQDAVDLKRASKEAES